MGHTGLYPRRPYQTNTKTFTLARLEGASSLVTEHGVHWRFNGWHQLADILREEELLCLSSTLEESNYPWIVDAYQDRRCQLLASRTLCLCVRNRDRKTYYVVPAQLWGRRTPDSALVQDLRDLFTLTDVQKCTPGRLGAYLMQRPWMEHEDKHIEQVLGIAYHGEKYWEPKRQHSRPGKAARDDIKDHTIGARIERRTRSLGSDTKLDLRAAFASHTSRLPTGTACRTTGDRAKLPCATWFARCIVRILRPLRVAVFAVRDGGGTKWVTSPGTYGAWLWREQAHDIEAGGGAIVERYEGWYWKEFTEDLKEWQVMMSGMMERAPNDGVRELLKLARNAAIGTMGATHGRRRVIDPTVEPVRVGDRPVCGTTGKVLSYLRDEATNTGTTMVHWWSYTLMQVQRTMYRAMHYYMDRGASVVAVLTDCLVLRSSLNELEVKEGWRVA